MANRGRNGFRGPQSCVSFETICKSNKKAQMGHATTWASCVSGGGASGAGLHSLDQEVKVGAGQGGLLGAEQGDGRILHGSHCLDHARHRHPKAVVHLTGAHQTNLLDHLGAAGEHAVGDQPQIPAVITQALGPLLLAEGIASGAT